MDEIAAIKYVKEDLDIETMTAKYVSHCDRDLLKFRWLFLLLTVKIFCMHMCIAKKKFKPETCR